LDCCGPTKGAKKEILNVTRRERQTSKPTDRLIFETLVVQRGCAVLFADIAAPPMNLLGPELVRDLVALIKAAEAD